MIIMINGPFGVGKTTTANKLLDYIPNSMRFDPEEIGFMLQKIIDKNTRTSEETDCFQSLELWKILTVNTAKEIKKKYNKNLIVPMTIKPANFEYIYNGFKEIDEDTFHFCLMATEETIHKRLTERGDEAGSFSFRQTKKILDALSDDRFEEHIDTEKLDSSEIVEAILQRIRQGHIA